MLYAAIILCPLYSIPASHVIPHLALPVSDLTVECRQLDWEAASWRSQAFAPSTKATYTSHLRCFLKFCAQYRLCPCPADDNTIVRYASFLARSKCYGSVVQYLNIIRIIHQEFGLPVPSQDNWYLSTVLRGIKRSKGHRPTPKAPILPQHLHMIYHQLRLHLLPDLQFWAATLTAFFGLLRIGNITGPNSVLRSDIILTSQGIILTIRNSKTIQFGERVHKVVLPYISNNHLCPVTTLLKFLSKVTNCPLDAPLFATCGNGRRPAPLTAAAFRRKLRTITQACPLLPHCSAHSLRKGGATWLLQARVPLATVRIIGDWASDAVYHYLLPDTDAKFEVVSQAINTALPLINS